MLICFKQFVKGVLTTCINEHFEDTSELEVEVDFPEKRLKKNKIQVELAIC